METRPYKVTSPIRHGGRICAIDETVNLTDAEASQFAGCIEATATADDAGSGGKGNDELLQLLEENGQLTARVEDLQVKLLELTQKLAEETGTRDRTIEGLTADLNKHQEAMATLKDEHEAAIQARDKAIAGLTEKISNLEKAPAGKKK